VNRESQLIANGFMNPVAKILDDHTSAQRLVKHFFFFFEKALLVKHLNDHNFTFLSLRELASPGFASVVKAAN
jgi:hypothetical protein